MQLPMSSNPSIVWPDLPGVHATLLSGAINTIMSVILPNMQSTYGQVCSMVANVLAGGDPRREPVRRLGIVLQQLANSAQNGQINNQAYMGTLQQFVINELQMAQAVAAQQQAAMMQPNMMVQPIGGMMPQPQNPFQLGATTQYATALNQAAGQPMTHAIQNTVASSPIDLGSVVTAVPEPVPVPVEKSTTIEVPKQERHIVTNVAIAVKQLPHTNSHNVFRYSEQMVAARSNGDSIRLLTANTLRGFASPLDVMTVLTDQLSRSGDDLIHKAMPTANNTPWAILVSYPQLLWCPIPTATFLRHGHEISSLAQRDTSSRKTDVTDYLQQLTQGEYSLIHAELMRQSNYYVRRYLHLGNYDITVSSIPELTGLPFIENEVLLPMIENYQFLPVWNERIIPRIFGSLVRRPLSISTEEDRSDTVWSIVCDRDDTMSTEFQTDAGIDDLCRHPQNMLSLNEIGIPGADAILFAKDYTYRQKMIQHLQERGTLLRRPARTLITNVINPLQLMKTLMEHQSAPCEAGEIRTMMKAIGTHRGNLSPLDLDSVIAVASYPGRKMWSHDIVQLAEYLPGLETDTNFGRFARWDTAAY